MGYRSGFVVSLTSRIGHFTIDSSYHLAPCRSRPDFRKYMYIIGFDSVRTILIVPAGERSNRELLYDSY
ncbi:hypothetical protein BUQ74_18430 [Leptospira weilii serovar Heyan]|uniref:Uncharacterized protein n=2 Tax=Leptospira weilii TaxID=28184 RepID=M6Q686_9LEPT|nr:hypothetical protein LEP1GSC108_2403 [Leptospira weilii str. UI 13098]OMI15905.1 hypothetical protein BUQ74_18430 [Leptospira weilii serovar Heyan]